MLSDYITPGDIKLNLESTEKEEAFAELTEVLVKSSPSLNRSLFMEALIERENKRTTAVFPRVAVPHAVCEGIKENHIALGISRAGIEFDPQESIDLVNPVVNVIFLIAFEKENMDSHLNLLRDILFLVSKPKFYERLLKLNTQQEIFDLLLELE